MATDPPILEDPEPKPRDPATLAISVLILLALAVFIAYLLGHLAMPEDHWLRAIYLLNGVEAVAFAAAGYIFAAQVQRAQINLLRNDAQRNAGDAARGRVLAESVQAAAAQARAFARGAASGQFTTESELPAPGPLEALRDLASRLFPASRFQPPGEP